MLVVTIFFRNWACDKQKMLKTIVEFSICHCQCKHDGDKTMVFRDISRLMKAMQVVDQTSSVSDGLKAFDSLVRDVLPTVFNSALGRLTFAYKHLAIVAILLHGAHAVDAEAGRPMDRLTLIRFLETVWRGLFQFPLLMGLLEMVVSCNLGWSRLQSACWVIFVSLLGTGAICALRLINEMEESDAVILLIAMNLVGPILLISVFGKNVFGKGVGYYLTPPTVCAPRPSVETE